ncbi:MAG: putative membrane protein YfcA [Halobacteriales archaeon]|jgi:uncharacterized membrane protein YfcA
MSLGTIALFPGFGLVVGSLLGFFGMAGSVLETPALLIFGYGSNVAVGSGMAFGFGMSVIATLKHRDLTQIVYSSMQLLQAPPPAWSAAV